MYNSRMTRKVLRSGDPVLRVISKPVAKIDKKILDIIQDLNDTLETQKEPEGVGLAAPQIGKNLRIFIFKNGQTPKVVINPEIISVSKVSKKKIRNSILEGCLSLPNYYGSVKRNFEIELKYQNVNGQTVIEKYEGLTAQIIQHEIDHLDGVLFVDRLLEQKKSLYELTGDNNWEEFELK